jgi:hypothetical protein
MRAIQASPKEAARISNLLGGSPVMEVVYRVPEREAALLTMRLPAA